MSTATCKAAPVTYSSRVRVAQALRGTPYLVTGSSDIGCDKGNYDVVHVGYRPVRNGIWQRLTIPAAITVAAVEFDNNAVQLRVPPESEHRIPELKKILSRLGHISEIVVTEDWERLPAEWGSP